MPIIGVVAKENESNFIKNEIKKNTNKNNYEIININEKSVENIKNIKFDCMVICDNIDTFLKKSNYLKKILISAKYVILNLDNNKSNLNNIKNVITYGLNAKSQVTISSIKEDDVLLCVQKKIEGVYQNIIEEQEFGVNIKKNNITKLYSSMVVYIILLIFGEK